MRPTVAVALEGYFHFCYNGHEGNVKPNLFIVGAPKCGTTAWVEYLSAHPDVQFSEVKEPHYFCSDFPRMSQVSDMKEYLNLFGRSKARIVGEASVLYLYSESAPEEIYQFNPEAKIIILVREQEEFLPSFHNQLCLNFQESVDDFELAWKMSDARRPETIPDACKVASQLNYKDMGRFYKHAKRYFDIFPHDQIRIFDYKHWIEDTRSVYLQILEFLALDDDGRTEFPRVNARARHRNVGIARFLQQPPRPIERSVKLLHKSFGVRSFGVAVTIERLNRRLGSGREISSELESEIREFYRSENQLLAELIWGSEINGPKSRRVNSSTATAI